MKPTTSSAHCVFVQCSAKQGKTIGSKQTVVFVFSDFPSSDGLVIISKKTQSNKKRYSQTGKNDWYKPDGGFCFFWLSEQGRTGHHQQKTQSNKKRYSQTKIITITDDVDIRRLDTVKTLIYRVT